ncbi:hypothetical protein [Nocardia sp. CNY236]|uniref:hypothetical protein n=1 Tax=Nocardia sp. CNY236 TaxID=1169152 RepID=UPI000401C68B|nr:hypothetical protein [Nocardia sp. CNY236]
MRLQPAAIGYLRCDVSGFRQQWHETQIRNLARRYGYRLLKTVTFTNRTDDRVQRLIAVVLATDAEAVFVPGLDHFGDTVPARLVAVADLNTVTPEQTWSRRP